MNKRLLSGALSGLALICSCVQQQPKPTKLPTIFTIEGKVKGESKGEDYLPGTPIPLQRAGSAQKYPYYTFVLETEKGFKTFTSYDQTDYLDSIITPGDEVKVSFWRDYAEPTPENFDRISLFLNSWDIYEDKVVRSSFLVTEINGKKVK